MSGKPVKLTFDLSYPDHASAYAILKKQKQTTQFIVNLILGLSAADSDTVGDVPPSNPQVTAELPASNLQATRASDKLPASNLQVTRASDSTTLADIPADILSFL